MKMNKYKIDLPEDTGIGELAKDLRGHKTVAAVCWFMLGCVAGLALCMNNASAAPVYRITDLGDLRGGRDRSFAVDINNAGWIVGEVSVPGGPRAAVWKRKRNGTYKLVNLGVGRGDNSSLANSINAGNTVVGRTSVAGDISTSRAVRWVLDRRGQYVAHGVGANSNCENLFTGLGIQANAINDSGSIVGTDGDCSFLFKRGIGIKPLFQSQDGAFESLSDFNASGLAVGTRIGPICCDPTPVVRNTVGNKLSILEVEELGHFKGYAEGINNAGFIVGQAGDHFLGCCDTDAVLWSPVGEDGEYTAEIISPPHDPNAFTTEAMGRDINRHNQVVGSYRTLSSDVVAYAFYWHKAHGFLDLNKLVARRDPLRGKFILLHAYAINDRGLIVGYGLTERFKVHAFLLTPR